MQQEPARLGEYVLLEKLGQGGMATVYRGERTGSAGFRKQVALKRMIPQYRRNPALLERFAAEARTNARLDHPNLVGVVDFGIDPEPYLVMEFVEGVTLALLLQRLVERNVKLEIAAACFIGAEAAQGLDHAHRKRDEGGNPLGIVHRDVSPQNVLLSNEGSVKVSDFGLVKAADNVVQTGSGVPIGKISYMAPEQAGHEDVDARADVFSLGIVVWEMLAMRVLVPSNDVLRASHMMQACDFPPPSKYNSSVTPELDAIVMACLTKDPTYRTPSAQALGMSLREMLHDVAPGYGRDQLARLVGWAFPERGWQMDEPHGVALQPSAEERLSIPQIAAASAMARVSSVAEDQHHKTIVDVQRADPMITGPRVPAAAMGAHAPPEKEGPPWLWIAIFAGGGFLALLLVVVVGLYFFLSVEEDDTPPPGAVPTLPMMPTTAETSNGAPAVPSIVIEADIEDAALFRGATLVGALPQTLTRDQLTSGPFVAIAVGHHPVVLDPQQLSQRMSRGRASSVVGFIPSRTPQLAVYVEYPRAASARVVGSREEFVPVPGVVLVPSARFGVVPKIEILEHQRIVMELSTALCDPMHVCSLRGELP